MYAHKNNVAYCTHIFMINWVSMGIRGMPCGWVKKKNEIEWALNFPTVIFHEQRNIAIVNPPIWWRKRKEVQENGEKKNIGLECSVTCKCDTKHYKVEAS